MDIKHRLASLLKLSIIRQFFSYLMVGGCATFIDWGVFYALHTFALLDYRLSVMLSFTAGATTNYLLNRKFTFRDTTKQVGLQVGVYTIVSLLSLALSVGFMWLFVDAAGVPAMLARMITTGLMMVLNFVLHKFVTFNQRLYAGRSAHRDHGIQ